jgi:hypothetical protein
MRATAVTSVVAVGLWTAVACADTTIKWDEAEQHVGEEVTLEGRVLGVHCSQLSCILAFDPAFKRIGAVIRARHFDALPPADLDRLYSGRQVRVRGTVTRSDGQPRIVLQAPEDLTLVHAERRQQREAERSLKVQIDILERLNAVLTQLVQLTERMGAAQERMEAVLASLEEREGALAAAQASQPLPPPPPSYGEPQPRPAFESLRTVKRGMSRRDVQRLIGTPQYEECTGLGWTTWYYGYGRSISFDERGRAQSLVGFPAP